MADSSDASPAERLQRLLSGAWITQALYVTAELGLVALAAERPHDLEGLARATGCRERSLGQLLAALVALDILAVDAEGRYTPTETGDLLRPGHPGTLHSWTLWWGRELWPIWGELGTSVRTGEGARGRLSLGGGFGHLEDGERVGVFHRAMAELTRRTIPHILAAYPFQDGETVVDVGGGYGELLGAILVRLPRARGVLLEHGSALPGARARFEGLGVADRCELVAGDFFTDVPDDADRYVLKHVLHDWPDQDAGRLLSACRRAMRPGARLVIIEHVVPADGIPDEGLAHLDLTMLVAHGARERKLAELQRLLGAAGLEVARVVDIDEPMRLIEAVPARA